MRYLKTYENTEYDYLIDKFCVYYYDGELCLALIKEIVRPSFADYSDTYLGKGLEFKEHLGNWTNYSFSFLEIVNIQVVDVFDNFKDAEELYNMIKNAEDYNL